MGAPANLKINVLGDARNAQRAMSATDDSFKKMERSLRGVSAAASTFNLSIAFDQVSQMITKASDLGETMSAVEQVFGKQAAAIKAFAKTADKSMGLSETAALGAAKTFAVFGKSAGLTGDKLTKFSTGLITTATDLASFHNTSPEQAIEALGAALRGESEGIRQYGILLDDATVRQRALRMGLIKTTKDALTPQQKVLASQAEIMAQLGDAAGDFQKTSDSTANTQRKLTAEWENAQATLGELLLPYLQQVMGVLEKVIPFIKENSDVIVPLVGAIGAWAAVQAILNGALAIFESELLLPVLAIAALIAIVVLAYNKIDGFRKLVDSAFKVAKVAWDAFWKAVQEGRTKIEPSLEKVKEKFDELSRKLQPFIEKVQPWIEKLASFLGGMFVDQVKMALDTLGAMIDGVIRFIDWIKKLVEWIKDLINWIGKIKWPKPPAFMSDLFKTPTLSIATVTGAAAASSRAAAPSGAAAGRMTLPQIRIYLDGREIRGAIDRAVVKIQDRQGIQLATRGWA